MGAVLEVTVGWYPGLDGREVAVGCCGDEIIGKCDASSCCIAKARRRSLPEKS